MGALEDSIASIFDGSGVWSGAVLLLCTACLIFTIGLGVGIYLGSTLNVKHGRSTENKENIIGQPLNTKSTALDLSDIDESKMPKHIAVIMDGNRRYGKEALNDPLQGHWTGLQTFLDFTQWCLSYNITTLTAYAFSTENWSRDEKEVEILMSLFIKYAESFREEAMKKGIRVKIFSTEFSRLPAKVQASVLELQQCTQSNKNFTVNFCLSYGSRGEIVNSIKQIVHRVMDKQIDVGEINESTVSDALLSQGCGDPDILIRTSGEYRLSNFLLWQLAYTELFFVKKYWPQLTQQDLADIIRQFANRHRRFGT